MATRHDAWVASTLRADPRTYASPAAPGGVTLAPGWNNEPDPDEDMVDGPRIMKLVKKRKWADAAQNLVFMDAAALRVFVSKLPPAAVRKLHEVAIKVTGQNSAVALATATMDHEAVGGVQDARAADAARKLSPADTAELHKLMDGAKPEKELDYLQKGLAAGHSVAELKAFDAKIAGKDAKWLQDNLSLTGNSKGKGVKQQWSMSCNATTVEAVHAELDPLYALKMHEDNPNLTEADDANGMKLNPKMAADQKQKLESKQGAWLGGQARNRGDTAKVRGRGNTDLLNDLSATTGLAYQRELLTTPQALETGIQEMNQALSKKMPVPIIVGDGGKDTTFAHYVLVTASDPGPPRYYSIHDPATGDTVIRSEDQIRKGDLNLCGGAWSKMSGLEKPAPVKVPVR